jgi:hypothetical protein
MAIAYGTQAKLVLYPEDPATYGTIKTIDIGTPAVQHTRGYRQAFVSESLKLSQQSIDSNSIPLQRGRLKPALSNINVSGSITTELAPQSCHFLLYAALGKIERESATTGGVTVYTYTFKTDEKTHPGLSAEVYFGENVPSAYRYLLFRGCKINNMTLQIPNSGFVTANYDLIGKTATRFGITQQTVTSSPTTKSWFSSRHTPFSSYDSTITIGLITTAVIESLSLSLTNALDESVYTLTGDGVRSELPAGIQTVTGQFTALFDNDTADNILSASNPAAYITITPIRLNIKLRRGGTDVADEGKNGEEYLEINLPNVFLERTSPEISGPGGVKIAFSFKAFYVAGSNTMTITVKTTDDPFELTTTGGPLTSPPIPKALPA